MPVIFENRWIPSERDKKMLFLTEGDPGEKAFIQQQPDRVLVGKKQAFKSLIPYVTE